MPGGSKGAKAPDNNIASIQPPWMAGTAPATMPAFAPGQQQALASQLAMGGFGSPAANLAYLGSIYSPAQTFRPAPASKPSVPSVPATGGKTPDKPAKSGRTIVDRNR